MEKLKNILGIVGFFALFIGAFFGIMWLITLLWNVIMPKITSFIGEINIWQMMGLLVICLVLFSDKSKIIEKL